MTQYLTMNTPALGIAEENRADYGLEQHGLEQLNNVYWNLPRPALVEEAVFRGEGNLVGGGPLVVNTGTWTERVKADKYIVREPTSENLIHWGEHTQPFDSTKFSEVYARVIAYFQGKDAFVQDCYACAAPDFRMPVRIITDKAWQNHFARNMFIRIRDRHAFKYHVPEFTVIVASAFQVDPRIDNTNSNTAVIIDFSKRVALVCNTEYGGEIKKALLSALNYLLPLERVLPLHCTANVGSQDDVALFFGLAGSGKTTLANDTRRSKIGDDEHAWWSGGVFNLDGGFYPKVLGLSAQSDAAVFQACLRFGAILENVGYNETSREVDFYSDTLTHNTRASFPRSFISNIVFDGQTRSHPKHIFFLACDATGTLPPVARLNPEQAVYHFISGYTSLFENVHDYTTKPSPTFSACFAGPFMVLHPYAYADMLKRKMIKHSANVWLINTGWAGGPVGTGKRIALRDTQAIKDAVLAGQLASVKYRKDPVFGYQIPLDCPGVPAEMLDPRGAWDDPTAYDAAYEELAAAFRTNFLKFEDGCPDEVKAGGPH